MKGGYPGPGSYNDQDTQLMDDWHTLNKRYLFIYNELKPPDQNSNAPKESEDRLDFTEL